MTRRDQKRSLVVRLFCAALVAQIAAGLPLVSAQAAVPVEESVEDSAREDVRQANPTQPRATRPAERARSLDIPPTIEPTVNTDYGEPAELDDRPGPAPATLRAADAGQLSELFYQLQILQQEIQDLRGQVEEQGYLVERLQRDQKEQYLDLDRRLVAISENQPAPGPATSAPVAAATPAGGGAMTELQAYTNAINAMKAREFDASMAGLKRLIETYPNGQYTANAYYWIGELELAANADPELARQSFMQVVNLYPDHTKVPDALYKLGVVYHNLGDLPSAKDYLERVQRDYPGSTAAGLAAKYAAELQ